MKKNKRPVSRKDDIVVQELDGEILIYDLRANKAFCLNETSATIWQACDGTRDLSDIDRFVAKRFSTMPNEDLVWLAIDQLGKEKLLETAPESDGRFDGMSRRDVIRKVGIGGAIALPIVMGIVAPKAAHANSACIAGGNCTCSADVGAGNICPTSVPCADSNCLCQQLNNGNTMGTCVP